MQQLRLQSIHQRFPNFLGAGGWPALQQHWPSVSLGGRGGRGQNQVGREGWAPEWDRDGGHFCRHSLNLLPSQVAQHGTPGLCAHSNLGLPRVMEQTPLSPRRLLAVSQQAQEPMVAFLLLLESWALSDLGLGCPLQLRTSPVQILSLPWMY